MRQSSPSCPGSAFVDTVAVLLERRHDGTGARRCVHYALAGKCSPFFDDETGYRIDRREYALPEIAFEADWYVSLRLGQFELAILAHDHPTVPEGYRALPRGVILNLEVTDVDAVHARLTQHPEITVVLPLRDEDFGQRHVIVTAPDDVLLDVIQPIAPTAAKRGAA